MPNLQPELNFGYGGFCRHLFGIGPLVLGVVLKAARAQVLD